MAKVLVVAPYVPFPARHGGAIRSRVLLDALRQDHEVTLAAAVADEAARAALAALATKAGIAVLALPAATAPRASLLRKLDCWLSGTSELAARRWDLAAAQTMVERCGADHDLRVADSSWSLPVLDGAADVVFLHNLENGMFAREDHARRGLAERVTRRMEARGLRNLERQAVLDARLTITVSEHDRDLALALAPCARVEVVPNSVDLDALPLLPLADPAAAPRLLFVGSLDYPPNLEAVTELCERHVPALRAAFPASTVRLVGKDPDGHGARFRGVPGVEVVGPVDDLVPHYRDTHAVYLPIRSGGGTRIKILEAWALGVPVLSTAVGAEGLPADDAHVARFETPEQGVAALRGLLVGDRAAVMRQSSRRLVEQSFSHAAAIARLRGLLGAIAT
ncbi:MAG: glycosyltransferase [Planctomycetes bacterium]|nr:glycosyltransferase [Planctomycetota bacterium]